MSSPQFKKMWVPQSTIDPQLPGWPPVGAFVPAEAVFPGIHPSVDELSLQLARLSRTDAIIWCAKLNLIVSNATDHDHWKKQGSAIKVIFSPEEMRRIESFVIQSRPEKITMFFRAQLLELMQWIAVHCHDLPGDGETFEDPSIRQAFGKAAVIVSELWGNRVYKNFDLGPLMEETRRMCLGTMRLGIDAASTGMDPIQAVARGRLLFLEHMSHIRPSVSNEFYSASGLPLERFFDITTIIASYFMLRTREMGGQPKDDMGLFHQEHFEQKDQELGGLFQKYARFACQSPEEFADAVRDSVGTYRALGRIRGRPILRTHDGRCIVMDPVYFAEHVAVGPLFAILGGTTGRESEQCFADFGHAFEHYCSQLFRRMYPASSVLFNRLECPVMGADQDGSLIQIADGCLNDLTDLVLFEFKSAWLPDEFTEADDPSRYLKALQDRYARANGPESPKGAGQLANTITHLANGEWKPKTQDFASTRKILPVLLCHDSRLEAPLHAWFLARQFHSALAPDQEYDNGDMRKGTFRVAGLIVLSVDDLEFLERSVEHFSLTELLRDYSQASPDRMCDMRSFLSISEYRKKVFASGILGESAIAAR